jgi:hypothetical protein
MAEKSDASEKKPAENSLSDKLADIAVKVLMGGGIAAGGSSAFWSLLVQSDIPKAIAVVASQGNVVTTTSTKVSYRSVQRQLVN